MPCHKLHYVKAVEETNTSFLAILSSPPRGFVDSFLTLIFYFSSTIKKRYSYFFFIKSTLQSLIVLVNIANVEKWAIEREGRIPFISFWLLLLDWILE